VARRAITDKAVQLLDEPVIDAVMVMRRPRWLLFLPALIAVPLVAGWSFVVAGLFGGLIGAVFTLAVEAKFIALTPTRLYVNRLRSMLSQPVSH